MEEGFTRQISKADAVQSNERRRTVRLLKYWEQQRSNRHMPGEEDLDITEIDDLMDFCFLIQIRDIMNEKHYNYTYIGSKIIESSSKLEGLIPGLATTDAQRLSSEYQQVMTVAEPLITEGEHPVGEGSLKYRQCLLPLSNMEGKITAILGHMSFRIYPPE